MRIFRSIVLAVASFSVHTVYAGSVTVSLANARNACRVISLPKWDSAPPPAGSELAFRAHDNGMLVGLSFPEVEFRVYSPSKYAVDLRTGKIRKASEEEWQSAEQYRSVRDWKALPGITTQPNERLNYRGKEFRKRGAKWPDGTEEASRLSGDGNKLAVYSWDGVDYPGGDLASLDRARIKGNYYVDVYDTASGLVLFSLDGRFRGIAPWKLFRGSAWITDRIYVLPLDGNRMNRFVLCDLKQTAGNQIE
jgi:hypothetical protein